MKIKTIINAIKKGNKIKAAGYINENAILLEAGQGKNINGNMFALLKNIEYDEQWSKYIPYFVVTNSTIDSAKERCQFYNFKKVQFVIRDTEEYWKLLTSCKYVMTDNSFPPLYTKQPGQVYLNTWHGTPLKYLGRSDIKNASSLGNIQKNYLMCDYALFPNQHTCDVFMKDYMLERLYQGKNVLADYPRNGILLDKKASDELRNKLGLNGKKVVAYMPTWRGSNRSADSEGQVKIVKEKLEIIDANLQENECFFVNLHFLVSSALDFSSFKHIQPFPKEYETYDFLNVCDVLITDYSSVFFDFAVTNKKIILYAYDKEEYLRDKGMYLDMDTFPFPIVQTEKELLEEIHLDNVSNREEFQKEFCPYIDEEIVNKVLNLVINNEPSTLRVENASTDSRPHHVYHVGHLGSHLTRSMIEKTIQNLNLDEQKVTLAFEGGITPGKVPFLAELPKDVYYYSIVKANTSTVFERLKMACYVRWGMFSQSIQSYLKKEKENLFYRWKIDEIHMFLFQKVKFAYLYRLFDSKKVFHRIPEKYLGLKVFKKWYTHLLSEANKTYDEVKIYEKEEFSSILKEVDGYSSDIDFKICKMNTSQTQEGIDLKLQLKVASYESIDLKDYLLKVGNHTYQPQITVLNHKKNDYYSWLVDMRVMIPFEESKGQELQNKICFMKEEDKYRITYDFVWRRINALKSLKIFLDNQRGLTYFFRYPKDSFTLTIRDQNVTDLPSERRKVVIAYMVSKLLFFFKPVLLFEKNAARYEESASVVYENLLDRGYRNIYFVLDKNYPFKDAIPEKYRHRIVDKYSFKHYVIFFAAKSLIGSESKIHAFELRPISKLVTRKLNRSRHNYVFLQHGVMYMISLDAGRRAFFKKSRNKKVRQRTIVSSQLELEHFTQLGGYKEKDLYLCGLPKFDRNVLNENPSKIVVMITWRPWEFIQSLDNIEETTYFKMLESIVKAIPEQYKEHLLVLPHPLVEGQMRNTENALQPYIPEVVKYDDILKDTKILITDYSSISYDAFYRGCNVIFCWQEKDACLVEYGTNAKLMLTSDLAFGDINIDYNELGDVVSYNYTHPQQEQHLNNYQKLVNFHDGHNTDRLVALLEKEKMI